MERNFARLGEDAGARQPNSWAAGLSSDETGIRPEFELWRFHGAVRSGGLQAVERKELLTIEEVAELTGFSVGTLYH